MNILNLVKMNKFKNAINFSRTRLYMENEWTAPLYNVENNPKFYEDSEEFGRVYDSDMVQDIIINIGMHINAFTRDRRYYIYFVFDKHTDKIIREELMCRWLRFYDYFKYIDIEDLTADGYSVYACFTDKETTEVEFKRVDFYIPPVDDLT